MTHCFRSSIESGTHRILNEQSFAQAQKHLLFKMASTGGIHLHHTPQTFSFRSIKQQNPSYPDTPPQTPSTFRQRDTSTTPSGPNSRHPTPEKHYKSRSRSHISPEWGPQSRDPEVLHATIYRFMKDEERVEAERDAVREELAEERDKTAKLKQKLRTKAAKIESLETERRGLLQEVDQWKAKYKHACSDQSILTPKNGTASGRTVSVKAEYSQPTSFGRDLEFRPVACPPEALAAAFKLPTKKSSQVFRGLGISQQAHVDALPGNVEAGPSVSQGEQAPGSSSTAQGTFYSCLSYGSTSSTPTIIRDCHSFSSSVDRPPVSPEFIGSPNWEPVFRLKDVLKEVSTSTLLFVGSFDTLPW